MCNRLGKCNRAVMSAEGPLEINELKVDYSQNEGGGQGLSPLRDSCSQHTKN